MKILILGATGMLGHTLFYYFSSSNYDTYATEIDSSAIDKFFPEHLKNKILTGINAFEISTVEKAIKSVKPDIVINCIGIIKQLKASENAVISISINSLFPHQLALICSENNSRLIHVSTDCVFSGRKGNYLDDDFADADDLYGRSKFLGEVDYSNAVTLRTSIIGHELKNKLSLIDWFMSQYGEVHGFTGAIYTGFPTIEFASIIENYVIPNHDMRGLYHVSSEPVSKYDLLKIVSEVYKKEIDITPDDSIKIDRSLNSDRFRGKTGYTPPSWRMLIQKMHDDYVIRQKIYS